MINENNFYLNSKKFKKNINKTQNIFQSFKKDFKERYPDAKFFSIRSGRLSPFNKDINNDNDIVDFLYSRNILNKAALYR